MCKLAIMSGITDETNDRAWEFIKEMTKQMSKPNTTEDDGVGYAAIDNEGKLFGERWLNNKEAFQHKFPYGSEPDSDILKKYKILNRDKVYNSFGTLNTNIRSITLHSRLSTNSKELKNNHPFVEGDTSVIHNGVIYNDEEFIKKTSTCDSEVILHQYIKHNVMNKPGKFKKVASKLDGYYAMGIYSKTSQGLVILDVIKDNKANLEAFFIKELNTIVFATPKVYGNPVIETCRVLGFNILSKYEVKSNRLQRFNAMTGEAIAFESFKPKEVHKAEIVTYNGKGQQWGHHHNHGMYPYREDVKSNFDEFFTKAHEQRNNNVIDMTSKKAVNLKVESMLESQLEDMLISDKEYTKEEVEAMMMKESQEATRDLESIHYNNDMDTSWSMDERYAWSKKNIT